MIARSQNGWEANDQAAIASYTVPGTALRVALRKGDVSVVLLEYLRRYNLEVEPLTHTPQDLWGFAVRTIRGSSTTLSNHSSGTAVDCRATRHGLGQTGTFTPAQLGALHRLVDWFGGVLRHGVDYDNPGRGGIRGSRPDPMHIEVDAGPDAVRRVADQIRGNTAPPSSTPPGDEMTPEDHAFFAQRFADLWSRFGVRPNDPANPAAGSRDRLTDLWDAIQHVATRVDRPAALTDADVERIVAHVVAALSERPEQP